MTTGFLAYNASGFLQIDENYVNLRIIAEGTASHSGYSTCTTADGWQRKGVKVTFSAIEAPMVLIQAKTDCFISVSFVSNSEFVFYLATSAGPAAGVISYKIIGKSTVKSNDLYGLRIWGAQSQLIFDSGATYAKATEIVSCPLSYSAKVVNGYYIAPAPQTLVTKTYTVAPWIFCNPTGPTFMFFVDWNVPSTAYGAENIAFKYGAGTLTLGASIVRSRDASYLIAVGNEPLGLTSNLSAVNYRYYNKVIIGELT